MRVRDRLRSLRWLSYAVAVHLVALLLLSVSLDWSARTPGAPPPTQIVQAVAVDRSKVEAEVQRLKDREQRQRAQEQARREAAEREVRAAQERRRAEEQRLAQLKEEQAALEQRQAAEQKRLKEVEQHRKREEEKRQQQLAADKKRQEEEKAKALAEQKRQEEKRRKEAEQRRLAEEKAQREAQKKAQAEKERREAEERRQRELKEALAAEEKAQAEAEERSRDESEITRYIKLIQAQIGSAFTFIDPESGLRCELLVRMAPGGDVLDARVVRSSGSATFDRQAEIAVRKASPLPVPEEPRLFQQMREIQFVFEPKA